MNYYKKYGIDDSLLPFEEKGGKIRGVIDLLTGCYPKFVFGGGIGKILPVFHFHEVLQQELEPRLKYIAENGYRTVTSDVLSRFVREGVDPGPFSVALCFDDALSSLYTVAFPLLRKYNLSAITYVIPSRVGEAALPRKMGDQKSDTNSDQYSSDSPFVTWPELAEMHTSGVVDIQCHTQTHSMVFCSDQVTGFITPMFEKRPLLLRPLISENGNHRNADPNDLGMPLYPQRSRMAECLRFYDDIETRNRCLEHVQANGGDKFFIRPGWDKQLRQLASRTSGSIESAAEREKALWNELEMGRTILNDRLGTNTVRHLCFPWGIAGKSSLELIRRSGYETAFSDRMYGMRAVKAGDDPFRLMRLKNEFIMCLPGRRRRIFTLVGW